MIKVGVLGGESAIDALPLAKHPSPGEDAAVLDRYRTGSMLPQTSPVGHGHGQGGQHGHEGCDPRHDHMSQMGPLSAVCSGPRVALVSVTEAMPSCSMQQGLHTPFRVPARVVEGLWHAHSPRALLIVCRVLVPACAASDSPHEDRSVFSHGAHRLQSLTLNA